MTNKCPRRTRAPLDASGHYAPKTTPFFAIEASEQSCQNEYTSDDFEHSVEMVRNAVAWFRGLGEAAGPEFVGR